MVPITTLGQKEINLVYNVKREQEGGLIKILVPKKKKELNPSVRWGFLWSTQSGSGVSS